jgi:uncharacterized spore protein YtfJ
MAENKNNFQNNVDSLFKGLDNFLTTKSVVGQPVQVGESIMIPLADVSFCMGAGAMSGSSRDNGGGGMGAKISPAAVLLIAKDGTTKLVNMKSHDAVAKIIDMAPDIITKIKSQFGPENNSDDFAE